MGSTQQIQTRVLVVDANPMSRYLTVEHLHSAGYDVVSATTGERALILLREWPRRVDWLYTAVELPGLVDGWILADEYHQTHPSRPVIYADRNPVERGARPYSVVLQWPVSPKAVLRTLCQADTHGARTLTLASQDDEKELSIAA